VECGRLLISQAYLPSQQDEEVCLLTMAYLAAEWNFPGQSTPEKSRVVKGDLRI